MATVYFVRGGVNSAERQGVREVPDTLLRKLNRVDLVFLDNPPALDPTEHISDVAAWQHVVINILPSQCSKDLFPKAGYYYVKEMSPTQFCEYLGLPPS